MHRDEGGIALRLILWALVLAVVLSAALFLFVRMQEPLAFGEEATVRVTEARGGPSAVQVTKDGRIWVATFLRNEGNLPVTIEGLALADDTESLYVPISLALGDGTTASPGAAASSWPLALDPGAGVGILVEYAMNASLDCSGFGADPGDRVALAALTIRASGYAVPFTQTVRADPPFARILEPSRDQCRRAVGRPGA